MVAPRVRSRSESAELLAGFGRIRDEFEVPDAFPADVLADAEAAAASVGGRPVPGRDNHDRRDRRDLPLVTIDPPGARDLDQALTVERRGDGFTIFYAIADAAAFVVPGGPLDTETRQRGATLYSPDLRTPLHPDVVGEGAGSLLPDEDRPALLWEIDLDSHGVPTATRLEPALVRSRAALAYADVQADLDAERADERFGLLRTIGRLRQDHETERGGVSLGLPEQEVVEVDGRYELTYRANLPVEEWNAQVSLLTGMEAARIMLEGGIGILRTLPPPDDHTLAAVRRSARKLGQKWPQRTAYADFVRSIDRTDAKGAALLHQAARALRGAGYRAFDRATMPSKIDRLHSAVAAPYAHATAPLRRLVDRFGNEVVLALVDGRDVPEWARSALATLPEIMDRARGADSRLGHAVRDFVEAMVLQHRVGEVFAAAVTNIDDRGAVIQLAEPAVLARLDTDGVALGDELDVRLVAADPEARTVRFEPA